MFGFNLPNKICIPRVSNTCQKLPVGCVGSWLLAASGGAFRLSGGDCRLCRELPFGCIVSCLSAVSGAPWRLYRELPVGCIGRCLLALSGAPRRLGWELHVGCVMSGLSALSGSASSLSGGAWETDKIFYECTYVPGAYIVFVLL